MPSRQNTLKEILTDAFGSGQCPRPTHEQYRDSPFREEISLVYKKLGGTLEIYPTAFRGFDIKLKGLVVELDEEQHFNRYRFSTLGSEFYDSADVQDYLAYCESYEAGCLKRARYGGYWKTPVSVTQFGPGGPVGEIPEDFSILQLGASRWKQRAFYDYLRDVGSRITGYKLVRVSVYDRVAGIEIGEILQREHLALYDSLITFVQEKAERHQSPNCLRW